MTNRAWIARAGSLALLMTLAGIVRGGELALPQHVWIEAESMGPLRGSNFSFQPVEQTTRGAWSLSGPGVAAEWTQGGESEFLSVAARADEPGEVAVGREVMIPAAGRHALWIRYADYRGKAESIGVRVTQAGKVFSHVFGGEPLVDEMDPLKLYWDWSFGWAEVPVPLDKGPARVELFTPGPSAARRQVDCLCLTTDAGYRPAGREKPDFAAWGPLRAMRKAGLPDVAPIVPPKPWGNVPASWRIATGPPTFLWNVGQPWLDELKKPAAERLDHPFGVDPPLREEFLKAYRGKPVPIFGDKSAGPAWHIPNYPAVFAKDSPFNAWLDGRADKRFAILLNYGEPTWPKDADRPAVREQLRRHGERFVGYIAGENIAYANVDEAAMHAKIKAAKSRGDVLAALREAHTAATVAKFSAYYGAPVKPEEAWADVISCLSANNEAFAHALADWGCRRIGHENTGNSPTLARRLAFLRGAARQFGAKIVDYQSINFGDSATMFSREAYHYPATSRYILDNQYDAWAGAGVNWLLKDYFLFHLAGVDAFYNEQGIDLFWKPGGNSAGDGFPVQLSPKGRTAEAVIRLASAHPRGTQYTPVAFLLDAAHGYSQERFQPAAFALDAQLNPAVLTPGRHEAAIRGWFDVAYFPAPDTQSQPAAGGRQTYVNGLFGDIFDVIVTAPRAKIVSDYPVVIAAGEVGLSEQWGAALRDHVEAGGTLVVSADQLSGPGAAALGLPALGAESEASAFAWRLEGGDGRGEGGPQIPSNVFRHRAMAGLEGATVLAAAPDGSPLAASIGRGRGRIVLVAIPLGLGVDERPVPLLGLLMRHLTQGLVPVKVNGDVEWTLNRLDDGGWAIGLLNNHGVDKPQHGVNPTDHRAAQRITLTVPFKVAKSGEWVTGADQRWEASGSGATASITVPAGAIRLVGVHPAP